MTVRIGWDEYEVALLIDACNRIRDNKIDKAECVHKLSNSLRQRAKANGINIDEVFRNENGIALQMIKMEYLLTDGKKGLPGASKLYIEMAKMSKLNSDEFEKILILAKEQIGYKEAMNNMNTREKFIQWLSSNPISKYSSNTIVNALDEGSEYCCSRSLSKVSFWDMNNKNEFITVASKLLGMKIYRLMHKKTANVKIDHTEEIEEYFLSAGKPMRLDDVFSTLSHIPQERVDRIIKTDSRFLRNSKGEYFHTDIFEITDDELENIAEIIEGFISEDEYAIWTSVWNMIQDKFPLFVENNLYLSGLGIRNAIEQRFSGRFRFEGAVISLPKDSFSMRDVYQLYAKHHAEFTADEIYILSKELDTVIYFDALSEVSVRVSHDLFVSKKRINFDVDSVDKVIESFMSKDYIRIREIDSFLAFPSVGYEWNEYMLESFLISYSKKFILLNNGQSLHNVAGAIVKKDGKIKEFEDACAAVLSESRIELKKSEALNYLADVNMITRRSYKDLDTAMRKATLSILWAHRAVYLLKRVVSI